MWAMLAGVPGKLKTLVNRLTAARAANLDNLNATVSSRMPGTATEQGRIDAAISSRAPSSTALSNATWTDTKAGFLDIAISSRAPSSTALSNATWTDTKAGFLDTTISSRAPASTALSTSVWTSTIAGRIDTTISSRAAASTALSTAQWTNTLASNLAAAASGGSVIKSIQTDAVATSSISTGTGEDTRFIDVTISAVTTAKCVVLFEGGWNNNGTVDIAASYIRWSGTGASFNIGLCTARLTSTTNLRISTRLPCTSMAGRWQVIEFN